MSELALLQTIHDRFDVYERYPYTDHSVITSMNIDARSDRYRVTTFPGGCGTAFDGFSIDVAAAGGMFDHTPPSRVETSRDSGPLMIFTIEDDPVERKDGLFVTSGTLSKPAKKEGLYLPGDDGFELFAELHEQLLALQPAIQEAVATTGVEINPVLMYSKYVSRGTTLDHDRRVTTEHRGLLFGLGDGYESIDLALDGTSTIPFADDSASADPDIMMFSTGSAEHTTNGNKTTMELGFDSLFAFSCLFNTMRELYHRSN